MLVNAERLQARMDRDGLDGLIAASVENVFYLTGVQPSYLSHTFAVITRDTPTEPKYVTSVGTLDQVLDAFPGVKVAATYGKFYRETNPGGTLTGEEQYLHRLTEMPAAASALDALGSALAQMNLANKRIGVDESGSFPALVDQLRQRVEGKVQPATDIFRWARMVKTDEEVRRLRRSANVTERALIACKGILRVGVTEREVAREFERSIVGQGGVRKFVHVRFGRNGVAGMAKETDTRLQMGDTVWFDVGCVFEGYCSDLARVFSLGEPNPRMKVYYAAMLAGEEAAIRRARPGMTAGELFDLTVQVVRENGVPHYRRTHVGHAIGIEVYDTPLIAAGVSTPLEEGMVITIETPYYEFGFGAAHAEDPFLMQANGNVVLTELSRDLQIVA
jgi:Xaa-Pro dipeptidase